jgi:long-subunit fatty acid transport protein
MLPRTGNVTSEAGKGLTRLSFALVAAGFAVAAGAQEPSPEPDRLFQDELDLQASLNVVQGSGARALGMGGAFLARADDATAASWNPAGLSYLRLPEVSFVWLSSNLSSQVRDTSNSVVTQDDRNGHAPDFVAFAFPYSLGRASGSAQVSYQRVISFTSDRTITDVDRTRTVSSSGGFDVLALGTGLKLSRTLRAGFTVNHWFNGYKQVVVREQRDIPTRQNANYELSGWNLHAGLMWSPWESLNLGAVLKNGLSADMSLRRSRVDRFPDGATTTNAFFRDDVVLDLPGATGVGASWRPKSNLTVSLDFTRTNWSDGRIFNFFTLKKTEPGQPPPEPSPPQDFFPRLPYPTLNDPKQKNTKQVRVGVEYVILRSRLKWPVRMGYFSDEQFFRAQGGTAPTFNAFTFGAGIIVSRVLFDIAYVYETGDYTSLREDLRNSVKSHRIYASLIYRHPR